MAQWTMIMKQAKKLMFLNYKELVFILKLKKFPDQQKKIRSIARPEKK